MAEVARALEFAGTPPRVPLFLVPELRKRLPHADLGVALHVDGEVVGRAGEHGRVDGVVRRSATTNGFFVSGTVPTHAKPGEVYLVDVSAAHPTPDHEHRVVEYLELIYVK